VEDQQRRRALARKEDEAVGQRDKDNSRPIGGCSQDDSILEERDTVRAAAGDVPLLWLAAGRMQEEQGYIDGREKGMRGRINRDRINQRRAGGSLGEVG
jgi:hypothetical protein